MTKELKIVEGEIQNISKNFKSVAINGVWYNSFSVIDDIDKGDNVKIKFIEHEKNDKTFFNIQSIEKIKSNNAEKITTSISDSTINTLIMTIKEIYLEELKQVKPDEPAILLSDITEDVIESYKLIKQLI